MSTGTAPAQLPQLGRLPSGRHKLSRDTVERSQRERILVGMLHSVEARGYPATTVADVVARAAVSRSTFYANFLDKEACFVASYGYAMDLALEQMTFASQALEHSGWRDRARSDLATYMDVLASEPALALTLHVEVLAAGPVALDHRAQMLGMLASRIAGLNDIARSEEPELPEIPPAVFALYTGGIDELIRDRMRTASPEDLRSLVEPVLEATFSLFGAH